MLIRSFVCSCLVVAVIVTGWALVPTQAFNAAPAAAEPAHSSGLLHRVATSTDSLIANLQARLRAVPQDEQTYAQLGLAYLQKARETGDPSHYQRAESALEKALALQPADYTAIGALGTLALARHQFAAALTWGARAQRLDPSRTYAYGVLADAQIELGRYDEAAATLQTMVDLRPDPSSYARVSYLRELHGDTAGAVELMRRAAASGNPHSENAAWLRTQLGNLYFNRGDLAQAEDAYRQALDGLPAYVYAMAGLGRVRFAQGRTGEAIALLVQAVQTMPLPEFVIALGDMYQATGAADAARQQYDLVGAIQQLYAANGVDLDLELALFNADHDRALQTTLQLARTAYARRPSIAAADVLAWVLYKTGAYREAQSYAEQALHLGTQDAQKFFHAGMIARAMGDRVNAKDHLERALALNPYFSIRFAAQARDTLNELTAVAQR